eukprot:Hpha_TRINITY_DN22659_c0_g1::TRINITY_DN22659_c0_g1_i1::g.192628::m.192628
MSAFSSFFSGISGWEISSKVMDLLFHLHGNRVSARLHEDGKREGFDLHYQSLLYDLVSTRRENIRDARDMRNERIQTMLLVATLVFGCAFGLLIEGDPPIAEDSWFDNSTGTPKHSFDIFHFWLGAYSVFLGLALTCSLTAMYLMWLLLQRMMHYKVHKPNENWCHRCPDAGKNGHVVESFDMFYACLCRPVMLLGHRLLVIALVTVLSSGGLLMGLRMHYEHKAAWPAIVFNVILVSFAIILVPLSRYFPPTDFRPEPPTPLPQNWAQLPVGAADLEEGVEMEDLHYTEAGDHDERELLRGLMLQLHQQAKQFNDSKQASGDRRAILRTLDWARALHVRHLLPMCTMYVCASCPRRRDKMNTSFGQRGQQRTHELLNLELTFAVSDRASHVPFVPNILFHAAKVFSEEASVRGQEFLPEAEPEGVLIWLSAGSRVLNNLDRGDAYGPPAIHGENHAAGRWVKLTQDMLKNLLREQMKAERNRGKEERRSGRRNPLKFCHYPQLLIRWRSDRYPNRLPEHKGVLVPRPRMPDDKNGAMADIVCCSVCLNGKDVHGSHPFTAPSEIEPCGSPAMFSFSPNSPISPRLGGASFPSAASASAPADSIRPLPQPQADSSRPLPQPPVFAQAPAGAASDGGGGGGPPPAAAAAAAAAPPEKSKKVDFSSFAVRGEATLSSDPKPSVPTRVMPQHGGASPPRKLSFRPTGLPPLTSPLP